MTKLFHSLPPSFQELLKLGLGFYVTMSGIALFCNWNSPYRWPVLGTLLLGLVLVIIMESLAAGFVFLVIKKLRDKTVNAKDR